MGLLQEIEGLFGFGKKANQTSLDAAAVSAAISAVEAGIQTGQTVINTLAPFVAENPIFAAAIGAEKVVVADAEVLLNWLKSLVPTAPAAAPAPAPPA